MSRARVIRARRYVSAPAGSYPRPSAPPPGQAGATAVYEGLPDEPLPAAAPAEDERKPEPLFMGAATDGAPSGVVVEDLRVEEPADEGDLPFLARDEVVTDEKAPSRNSRGGPGLVILVSGLFGVLLGAVAGLALLAFMEPARWMERFLDPLSLWNSTEDPLIRASAIMIVVGCGLIGALLPLRLRD